MRTVAPRVQQVLLEVLIPGELVLGPSGPLDAQLERASVELERSPAGGELRLDLQELRLDRVDLAIELAGPLEEVFCLGSNVTVGPP